MMAKSLNECSTWLHDVDALLDPIVVVPDVSEDVKRKYFHVVSRKLWTKQFTDWVERPYEDESKRTKKPQPTADE